MSSDSASSAPSELRAQRWIALTVTGLTLVLAFGFRNERELVMPAPAVADREASAFTATVATPSTLGGFSVARLAPGRRGVASNPNALNPGTPAETSTPAVGSAAAATGDAGAPVEQSLLSLLPQELQSGRGSTSAPQMASFIGLPGGVVFRAGGATPPVTAPTPTPTDIPTTTPTTTPTPAPSDGPGTPANPEGPTVTPTPTAPNNPSDPVNPSDPTDPGNGEQGTPGNPVLPPTPGPGAVPEPGTWVLMILGMGVVGTSLRRRRRAARDAAPSGADAGLSLA